MFKTQLVSFIHPEHELCLLAKKINWEGLEKEFAPLYGTVGRPSVPIRTIVGLLLLKQMYNKGDETVVERYLENPYWQHFCGEIYFQYNLPFDPSDFVHFRHRIGKDGMEKIFKQSIDLFGSEMIRKEVKEVRWTLLFRKRISPIPQIVSCMRRPSNIARRSLIQRD